MSGDADLKAFKEKLSKLEISLRALLKSSEEDLEIAQHLQKVLHPNRIPKVPGLKCLARFISAQQLNSEGFDIIPTLKGKESWIIASWTESFGLSSILLQSMVHIQSKALVESRPDVTPSEIFNELSISLASAKRAGNYRLLVAKLDNLTLKINGFGIGVAPFLTRKMDRNEFGEWSFAFADAFKQKPELFEAANSATPVLSDQAYAFAFTVPPGSRLFYLSRSWFETGGLDDFLKALKLDKRAPKKSELIEDLNLLLIHAEDHMRATSLEADITVVALEVDSKKLHLA